MDEESKIKDYALLVQRCSRLFLLKREVTRRRNAQDVVKVFLRSFARCAASSQVARGVGSRNARGLVGQGACG